MPDLKRAELERYLEAVLGAPVTIFNMAILGGESDSHDVKAYGYGIPLKVDFQIKSQRRSAVLHTMTPGPFGHEHMADRARELLWEHHAFNRLARHVRSLDVGGFQTGGQLVALGKGGRVLFAHRVSGRRELFARSGTHSRLRCGD